MKIVLPLDLMTTAENLEAIDRIWNDLMRNPNTVPLPDWHKDVLSARVERVKNGQANFKELDEVKMELRAVFQ